MKIVKRIIAVLLCIALVLNFSSFSGGFLIDVQAEEETNKCGENVYWEISGTILRIYGTGDMYDYTAEDNRPWKGKNLSKVVIEEGVTSVGDYTFAGISNIQEYNLADSIRIFGENAFAYTAIRKLELPKNLEKIEEKCFYNAPCLTEVDGEQSIKNVEIDEYAFSNCSVLATFIFPQNTSRIGDDSFYHCILLREINIPDSVLYIGENAFAQCSGLKNVILGKGLKEIGKTAFNTSGIESVSFTEGNCSLEIIGEKAFYGCVQLKTITIPNGTREIGKSAFEYCSYLEKIEMPDSIEEVGEYAFSCCHSISSVKLSKSIKYLKKYVFTTCSKIKKIEVPEGVEKINSYAFQGCDSLEEVEFPKSLEIIENENSSESISLNKLKKIVVRNNNLDLSPWKNLPWGVTVYSCPNGKVEQWVNENKNKGYKFEELGHEEKDAVVENYTGPTVLEEGYYDIVKYCDLCGKEVQRTRYSIPMLEDTPENIYSYEIRNNKAIIKGLKCAGLSKLYIPQFLDGYEVVEIKDNAFYNDSFIENLTFPTCVKKIGNNAMSNCKNLLKITINAYDCEIGDSDISSDVKVYGCSDSAADIWAHENGVRFYSIGHREGEIIDQRHVLCSVCNEIYDPELLKPVPKAPKGLCLQKNELMWNGDENSNYYNIYVNNSYVESVLTEAYSLPQQYVESAGKYKIDVTAVNYVGESTKSTVTYISESEIYVDGNYEAGLGEQIQIPVKIRNNSGLMGYGICMEYDKSSLRPVSVTKGPMITNGLFDDNIETATSNKITVFWSGNSEISADGILFYVTFEVIGNKASQSVINMDYQQDDTFDENWNNVPLNCGNIMVTISTSGGETNTSEEQSTSGNTGNKKTTIVGGTYSFDGDSVNVPIMIQNNHGIMGYRLRLNYDNTILQPMNVERQTVYEGSFVDNIGVRTNYFDVIWTGTGNVYDDLELFVVKFKVLDPSFEQTTVGVSYIQGDTFDESWQDVTLECSNIELTRQNETTAEITTEEETSTEVTTKEVTTEEVTTEETTTEITTTEKQTTEENTSETTTEEETTTEPETNVVLPPAKPSGLQGVVDKNDNYNLFWILSEGAIYYNVYVNGENVGNTVSANYRIPASFFTKSGDYTIEVEAVNNSGVSEKSAITYVVEIVETSTEEKSTTSEETPTTTPTTVETTKEDVSTMETETSKSKPSKPTGVQGIVDKSDNYNLFWMPSKDAIYYQVYVNGEMVGNTVSTNYRIPASFFAKAGKYTIEVDAVNELGTSDKEAVLYEVVFDETTTGNNTTEESSSETQTNGETSTSELSTNETSVEQTTKKSEETSTEKVNPTTKKVEKPTAHRVIIIKPSKVKGLKVKNVKKKKIIVSWKWKSYAGPYGWQVQYARKKNFKSAVTKNVGWIKEKLTLKKLKKKKTYYIRVRAWVVGGDQVKRYGSWSKKKKCKVKK